MNEAPASANVKFVLNGFECQFTIRGEDQSAVFARFVDSVGRLQDCGAVPSFTIKAKGNGNGNGQKPPAAQGSKYYNVPLAVCPVCQSIGDVVSGEKEDGTVWTSQKCPQCDEWLKGTFRWGVTPEPAGVPA